MILTRLRRIEIELFAYHRLWTDGMAFRRTLFGICFQSRTSIFTSSKWEYMRCRRSVAAVRLNTLTRIVSQNGRIDRITHLGVEK